MRPGTGSRLTLLLLSLLLSGWQYPQSGRRYLPPPLRVFIPFEASWDGMRETVREREIGILEEERAQGRIVTEFVEYSSGLLTERHIAKIGEKPKLLDGEWVRVEYQYDIDVQLVGEKETLVTVYTNIRALQRRYLGGDKWVNIASNGRLEQDLLTVFGQGMFGQTFSLDSPRKTLWDYRPDDLETGEIRPGIIGPERRKPQ